MLKKDVAVNFEDKSQKAIEKINDYISNPHTLVPQESRRSFCYVYQSKDNAFNCTSGQHDETGKKEQTIYYMRKKFTLYEARYSLFEHTCCALSWVAQKLF